MTKASSLRACARGDEAGCWGLALGDAAHVGGVLDGAALGQPLEGDVVTLGELATLAGGDAVVHVSLVVEHHGVAVLGEDGAHDGVARMPVRVVAVLSGAGAEAAADCHDRTDQRDEQQLGLALEDREHEEHQTDDAAEERQDEQDGGKSLHEDSPLSLG